MERGEDMKEGKKRGRGRGVWAGDGEDVHLPCPLFNDSVVNTVVNVMTTSSCNGECWCSSICHWSVCPL